MSKTSRRIETMYAGHSQQFRDGYRVAARDAIAFLNERARLMNDEHAKTVLNSAAFNLSVMFRGMYGDDPAAPVDPVGAAKRLTP